MDESTRMTMLKMWGLVGLCAAMTACATVPSAGALKVRDADSSMVQGCKFLGMVSGTSGWGGLVASVGERNAENSARAKAARMDANRIVWMTVNGGWSPNASGNAYRCPK